MPEIFSKNTFRILLAALFIEIFICNRNFWFTIPNHPEEPVVHFSDGSELIYDHEYQITDDFSVDIQELYGHIRYLNITLNHVTTENAREKGGEVFRTGNAATVRVSATDEGHANFYDLTERILTPYVPESGYFRLEPFGDIRELKIAFPYASSQYISFEKIELNPRIPLRFSCARFAVILLVFASAAVFFFADYSEGTDPFRYIKIICSMAALCMVLLYALHFRAGERPISGLHYQDLAHALSEKRLWIEENHDEPLASMENPYDYYQRKAVGAQYHRDTALFDGKYFIYFGVTPVLLFFLPYYRLTGSDLSYYQANQIIIVLIVIGSFILIDLLRKRVHPSLPAKVQILFSVLFAMASGSVIILKRCQIYYIAIGTALMLTIWGLCFWFFAAEKRSILSGLPGSFCLALAVGARPQFALAGFLVFPIFEEWFRDFRTHGWRIILTILPYIPIAAFLMWYNAARFGSPFDFGANYNMTGYDMVHMGTHPARLLYGFWYYLLSPVKLLPDFPYLGSYKPEISYPGFLVSENQIGGAFELMPIILACIAGFTKKIQSSFIKTLNRICVVASLIIISADTLMCGLLIRYQVDFRYLLLLASAAVSFSLLKQFSGKQKRRLYKVISGFVMISIAFAVMTVFAQYEAPDYATNPGAPSSWYCVLKNVFGIIGF